MKRQKRKLMIDRQTIRTLASTELTRLRGGQPANTEGDGGCPTTFTAPTCDGASCAVTECGNCRTLGKKTCPQTVTG